MRFQHLDREDAIVVDGAIIALFIAVVSMIVENWPF